MQNGGTNLALMLSQTGMENQGFEAKTGMATKQQFSFKVRKKGMRCITSKQQTRWA